MSFQRKQKPKRPVAFFQVTVGEGTPCAWQCKATCRLRSTLTSTGSTSHLGGTETKNNTQMG